MILRDLPLTIANDSNPYWERVRVSLADTTHLMISRPTTKNVRYSHELYWIVHWPRYGGLLSERGELDEFTAQAVLDHYVQTIGIEP